MRIPCAERNHQITLDVDEQYRSDAAAERLSKLPGIFGCKDITAVNIPGLNDDATAILLLTRGRANHHGVKLENSVSFPLFGRAILRGPWLSVMNNVTCKKGGLYERVYK